MTATIAIQDVLVPHVEVVKDLAACAAVGIKPIQFGLIPFSDEVTLNEPDDRPAIPFGSTKLVRLWLDGKLPKGWTIFYDEQAFDQRHWGTIISDLALNSGARPSCYGAMKDRQAPTRSFVKPATDLKQFAGLLLEEGETLAARLSLQTTDMHLTDDTPVIVAPFQEIVTEFRCFVRASDVGNAEIIEIGRYKTLGRSDQSKPNEQEFDKIRAVVSATRYDPAPFYVVDVAILQDGSAKIVEYNCINCSGRYGIDRGKLFQALARSKTP